ncbi:response regulator [Chitinophaga barathri]|uniref:Response regulator n=2 Tax=Chitinophaga barathri TaxID=1647451 RepID=A0A3N4MHV7_9BACT|nr:response regulator [Chitinophaga barathri]
MGQFHYSSQCNREKYIIFVLYKTLILKNLIMSRCHFLYIDDDPEEHEIFQMAISGHSSEIAVSCESDVVDALTKLKKDFENGGCLPDLIILDLNMPLMSGFEVLTTLKCDKRFQGIPVIVYTTSYDLAEEQRCMQLGAHSFITKPNEISKLISLINHFVEIANSK